MLEVTKVSPQWVPFGLAAFGVGGIIGNIAGGTMIVLAAPLQIRLMDNAQDAPSLRLRPTTQRSTWPMHLAHD